MPSDTMVGTVFDHITAQTSNDQDFDVLFHGNMSDIHEFDTTEIQDYLLYHEAE